MALIALALIACGTAEPPAPAPAPAPSAPAPAPAEPVAERTPAQLVTAFESVDASPAAGTECEYLVQWAGLEKGATWAKVVPALSAKASESTGSCKAGKGPEIQKCELGLINPKEEWGATLDFNLKDGKVGPNSIKCRLAG